MVPYWGKKDLFGEEVGKKFKRALPDIENAGNCLAVGQGTACVFHLMRAMDIALHRLASRLRIKIGPKDTWGQILNKIDPRIDAMAEKTQRQKTRKERWSEARTNLFHVKEAVRDPSSHAKRSYTARQATDVMKAVEAFMAHLASL
jgi:hypothetical protein